MKTVIILICFNNMNIILLIFVIILIPFCPPACADSSVISPEDAVRPFEIVDPNNQEKIMLEFKSSSRQNSLRGEELFVTIHSNGLVTMVRIFSQKDNALILLKEWVSSYTEVIRPNFFYVNPDGDDHPVQMIQMIENSNGSGVGAVEHVFEVVFDGHLRLKDAALGSAVEGYQPYLQAGESIRQDVYTKFTDEGLFGVFYIWNTEDANCCPSGGKVFVEYKVVRDKTRENSLSLLPDTFERYPILPGEY